MPDPTVLLQEFVDLENERYELEQREAEIVARVKEIEDVLCSYFGDNGIASTHVRNRIVRLDRKLWATAKDRNTARACIALRKAGLGDYVHETFNTSTLSAHFRSQEKLLPPGAILHLPPELAEDIVLSEVIHMRSQRISDKKGSSHEQKHDDDY